MARNRRWIRFSEVLSDETSWPIGTGYFFVAGSLPAGTTILRSYITHRCEVQWAVPVEDPPLYHQPNNLVVAGWTHTPNYPGTHQPPDPTIALDQDWLWWGTADIQKWDGSLLGQNSQYWWSHCYFDVDTKGQRVIGPDPEYMVWSYALYDQSGLTTRAILAGQNWTAAYLVEDP